MPGAVPAHGSGLGHELATTEAMFGTRVRDLDALRQQLRDESDHGSEQRRKASYGGGDGSRAYDRWLQTAPADFPFSVRLSHNGRKVIDS
jgi:hypothetical protein